MKSFNYVVVLTLLAISILIPARAGEVYLELGIGWIQNIPVRGSITIQQTLVVEEEVVVNIEQPYGTAALGIIGDYGWYAEVNRFGVITDGNRSLTRYEFGKRWRWKF